MKTHPSASSSLLLLAPAVSAWQLYTGLGFGDSPSLTNSTLFESAIRTANTSASAPFQLGTQTLNFQVNITDLDVAGADVPQPDPTAVFTLYSLTWSGGEDLNATVAAAEGLAADDETEPRLCATIPGGLFTTSVTNGYDFDAPGDCTGPLGRKCVDAITSAGFGGAIGRCSTAEIPEECSSKFSAGGFGTASVLTNETHLSPRGFAYYSQAASSGSQELFNAYEREAGRLHMVIFADQGSYHPVCVRVTDERVSRGDPGVSGAEGMGGGRSWVGVGILVAVVGGLFVF